MSGGNFLGIKEAAALCGVTAGVLRRWIEEDGVPLHRLEGRSVLYWKDIRKCLIRRRLSIPGGLESGPRVLVVDDNEDELFMMIGVLEGLWDQAQIGAALDGTRALEKLLALRPHLLVADVHLTCFNALSLCRLVRSLPELAHAKVIAVTGCHSGGVDQEASSSGADAFLTKPFAPEDLRRAAARLLGPGPFGRPPSFKPEETRHEAIQKE